MKLITCEVGEVITIGDNIRISIARIKGNQVGLGIDAPRDVVIHREEIKKKTKIVSVERNEVEN